AERIYRQLVDLGEAQQYRVPLALAYFGLAYLLLTRGEHDRGRELAERSWKLLSPTHAWQLYADQGERARVVCAALRDVHPDDPFLARVEAALGAPASPAPARLEHIAVDVLGEMRVTIAGQEVPATAWVSAKAHDLLAYLV